MGYTHYFDQAENIPAPAFTRLREDIQRVCAFLGEAGLPLAGPDGTGEAEFTADHIAFNGLAECGHQPDTCLGLILTADEQSIALQWSNGANGDNHSPATPTRFCDLDCCCEPFVLTRGGSITPTSGFCKTRLKPYDFAVTAALFVAKHHLGSQVRVTSDGNADRWAVASAICQAAVGYGNELIMTDDGLEPVSSAHDKPLP